jgi:hypothetical protein
MRALPVIDYNDEQYGTDYSSRGKAINKMAK